MIIRLISLLILLLSFTLSAQKGTKEIDQFVNKLDNQIPKLLNDFSVPGAGIAIIENGEIILLKGYGYSDIVKGTKVTTKTGFNIGSISKTVAAWGVMKLVQEGKIELDAPAEKYLTRWHLPKSEFDSDKVTIRRLLSHTAGLSLHGYPGWSPKDNLPTIEESLDGKNNGPGRVEIIMEPGTKWKYSGGGFTILQLIIEEVTKQKFEDYMQAEILNPLGMTNSSYTIDENILKASSLEHNNFGEVIDFELFTAKAAAGLHTTIEDFSKFALASLYKNKKYTQNILSTHSLELMMTPVPVSNDSYGLGYQKELMSTNMTIYGHGGANTGWQALFMINPDTNDGFVMLTNGGAGSNVFSQVICEWSHWLTDKESLDSCIVLPSIANKIKQIIDTKGVGDIKKLYFELKNNQQDKYNFSEGQLIDLGYYYLSKNKNDFAIAVFEISVEAFPNSFNAFDSYAEALLKQGEKKKAIENYKKSIKLNPENINGIRVLKKLGVTLENIKQ
ncbi:serine hydrolase domain-containing protein [Aequorivita capsosiphonis]|uniref:serine hydrolase domain-containing protein n=1 Tax=Aequorivita capsosiphonis TaxID=487317 RepID=UPI000414249C|nr:serine hydrolase domain-containing protein [Aequorivita capsosiphonis]